MARVVFQKVRSASDRILKLNHHPDANFRTNARVGDAVT